MKKFNEGWYVVYTKPRHEKKVCTALEDLGIGHFFAMMKKLRIWSDRRKYIDTPVFPSYIFIYLKDHQEYFKGLDVDGVLYYVRMGKEVAKVNTAIVDNLKVMLNSGGPIEVTETNFMPGQLMVIQQGPLAGFTGEVVEYNGCEKVLVRVQLFQRNVLMSLSQEYLMEEASAYSSRS
ncbi:MAG: UpxY family transcription antiterminator [Chitinophaga sp.]|uniref:UpxY family transcription antiterminator n=1 Tax=Chitinophaga sp. TaxID=1869181 RepID=UPI001B19C2C4|nr:UpxY family transcription antiterminator [Chitinophaga sp.]MBO9730357.1 UpxY family transcription antiterminator [Chitinophaga sp.]